jgi:hypothetical protein
VAAIEGGAKILAVLAEWRSGGVRPGSKPLFSG